MIRATSYLIFLLLTSGSFLNSAVSAQEITMEEIRSKGAFGFPVEDAQTLCDTKQLRVQVVCDTDQLLIQAVLWEDGNDELGETADGRPIGDGASVVFDIDLDQKETPELDRTYSLNPWPTIPGLFYTIPYKRGSSHLQRDSKGIGAIRYLETAENKKVRVDTFRIPLAEIKAESNKTIGIAYLGRSTKPGFTLNSVGYESKAERYYAFNLPVEKFGKFKLTSAVESLDLSQIPDGRKDKKRAKKAKVKPLLQIGSVPPPLTAKGWLGTDAPPTWEKLRGKVVLVDFWATWCGPCVAGIPHMNELQKQHKDDLVVLGVTDQSRGGIKAFQKTTKMLYGVGVGSELGAEFGAKALPHAFIIGRDGKLVWEGLPSDDAFDGKLEDALKKVLPASKAAQSADDTDKQSSTISLAPGKTQFVEFPSLGKTWQDQPTRAGIYLPTDYTAERKFPLLVNFGGGAGTDKPGRAITITQGRGFICVGVPYRPESDEQKGGWQTEWNYYKTIFDKIESLVPNIDPQRRACTGYSSGGAAILHQVGNSGGEFQTYFQAFMPTAAGWPMGGLDSIKGRPMLAVMGENDKRLPNYRKLETAAKEAGVDFELRVLENAGHKIPPESFPAMRQWLVKSLNVGVRKDELPAEQRGDFEWADMDGDGQLSSTEMKQYQGFYRRIVEGRKSLPKDVRIVEDVAYIVDGHPRQKLDIYLPPDAAESETPLPLVVWIHGGGWQKGTKELLQGQQIVLDQGFAFASINYRLIAHASFPAQIHDCKSAIRFLRANAATYNIDPNQIGAWGSSAGGHLVALLGVSGGVNELEGAVGSTEVSSRVQAVCDYFGPTNLFTQAKRKPPTGRFAGKSAPETIGKFLGGSIESNHHLCELASPYYHVDKDDPPFLLMHGDADPLVPLDQSTSFRDILVKAGVECELNVVPGVGHAFLKTDEQLNQVVEFFKQHLK